MTHVGRRLIGIAALNGSSVLAQIGQYGIAFVLFPIALQTRGVAAWEIGVASSALWLGMLLGLVAAPALVARRGHLATLLAGLAASSLALGLTPWLATSCWVLTAFATGFGLGLRWIGLETWLYAVAPSHARGRIVGLHEALLGSASVLGPVTIAWFGAASPVPFVTAALFTAGALLPLAGALPIRLRRVPFERGPAPRRIDLRAGLARWRSVGVATAGLGGMMEAAFLALFPLYAATHGIAPAQVAWLLTVFGVGAMVLQYPIGWLADASGLRGAALLVTVVVLVGALVSDALLAWPASFAVAIFALGGAMSGFLTLGLTFATEARAEADLDAEVSRVSLSYTALAGLGPLVASALVTAAGVGMLMVFLGVAAVGLIAILLLIGRSDGAAARGVR